MNADVRNSNMARSACRHNPVPGFVDWEKIQDALQAVAGRHLEVDDERDGGSVPGNSGSAREGAGRAEDCR